jgi:undecaprenyl-diphosphatase
MTSLIVYGSVAYVVGRLEPTQRLKLLTWSVAAFIILAVGISRMYLGVHYPSDVVGGFLAGTAWLTFVVASTKAIQFFAPRRPETEREEREMVHPPPQT